jgi:predicted amidophosphoribosyltransferase
MKYRPSFKLASFISEIMAENLNDLFKDEQQDSHWDLLIPLPSSSQSKSRRMFNQCSLLTLAIMRRTGLSAGQSIQQFFKRPALMHLGYSSQQATIKGADKRVSNVKGAFSASSGLVNGKAVLLVEDVVTSGATSLAAACALVKAGAASVDLIMLARHRGWQQHRRQMFEKFCV